MIPMVMNGSAGSSHGKSWEGWSWIAVGGFATASFALGFAGSLSYYRGTPGTWADAAYLTLKMFVLDADLEPGRAGWLLQIARFSAPATTVLTVIVAAAAFFRETLRTLRMRLSARGHAVVCGLGSKGLQIARELRERGTRVVAVERDEESPGISPARAAGAVVLAGDATDPDVLLRARLASARLVFATCGSDPENLRAADAVRRALSGKSPRAPEIACRIHLADSRLAGLLPDGEGDAGAARFSPFNVYDTCARQLFERRPLESGESGAGDPRTVHIALLGFGRMGESLARQALRIGHFANGKRIRLTVVDREGDRKTNAFLSRFRMLDMVAETSFAQSEVERTDCLDRIAGWLRDSGQILTIAVCLGDDVRTVGCALQLATLDWKESANLLLRLREDLPLHGSGRMQDMARSGRLHVFGQLDRMMDAEKILDDAPDRLARAVHEDYLRRMLAAGEKPGARPSLRPWERLSEDFRSSNRQQADHIPVKLRAVGRYAAASPRRAGDAAAEKFRDDEVEVFARMEHARWCASRILDGWQLGTARDDARKIHPSLVPWDSLGEPERDKDRAAVRLIPELCAAAGLRLFSAGAAG